MIEAAPLFFVFKNCRNLSVNLANYPLYVQFIYYYHVTKFYIICDKFYTDL